MAKTRLLEDQEPLGIVIADGGRSDSSTRFAAFVWGPVPDDVEAEFQAAEERELEYAHG